jgi:hypothetical protein
MSPRRRPPREDPEPLDVERLRRGVGNLGGPVQGWSDGDWEVRSVPASGKTYRCPGCDQEIRPGVGHVVAWPADERGNLSDRRHWHTGCWRARDRRNPNVQRGRSGPKYG